MPEIKRQLSACILEANVVLLCPIELSAEAADITSKILYKCEHHSVILGSCHIFQGITNACGSVELTHFSEQKTHHVESEHGFYGGILNLFGIGFKQIVKLHDACNNTRVSFCGSQEYFDCA